MKYQDKFITMKKIYRLACYKQHKESHPERNQSKTIEDVCPFGFTDIKEVCKNCRWFQIIDETNPMKQQLIDHDVSKETPIIIKIEDLDELPYDPNKKEALPG